MCRILPRADLQQSDRCFLVKLGQPVTPHIRKALESLQHGERADTEVEGKHRSANKAAWEGACRQLVARRSRQAVEPSYGQKKLKPEKPATG